MKVLTCCSSRTILLLCCTTILDSLLRVIDAWVTKLPFSRVLLTHEYDSTARRPALLLVADLSAKNVNRKVPSSSEEEEQQQQQQEPSRLSAKDNPLVGRSPPGLPKDYQEIGNGIISTACATVTAGHVSTDIEWKGDHIIVTLRGDEIYLSATQADEEEILVDDEEDDDDGDDAMVEDSTSLDVADYGDTPENGIDVTTVAKAINAALDCTEIGQAIAETHSIEVTTPGVVSDEIQGDRMFSAYRGFDVTVVYEDPKKNNKKRTIEGRLVERNDEHVIINVKGRMSKLVRDNVVSVKLPKAKREK
uniref:Uncharacterized protein n=1 Tax=Amphora coffeiformis TaxID=265554 RepID=A0A7S3L4I1_9STRA